MNISNNHAIEEVLEFPIYLEKRNKFLRYVVHITNIRIDKFTKYRKIVI